MAEERNATATLVEHLVEMKMSFSLFEETPNSAKTIAKPIYATEEGHVIYLRRRVESNLRAKRWTIAPDRSNPSFVKLFLDDHQIRLKHLSLETDRYTLPFSTRRAALSYVQRPHATGLSNRFATAEGKVSVQTLATVAKQGTNRSYRAAVLTKGSMSLCKHKTPTLKIESSSVANRVLSKAGVARHRDAVAKQTTEAIIKFKDLSLDDGKAFNELQAPASTKIREMAGPATFGFDGGLTKTWSSKAVRLPNPRKMGSTQVTQIGPLLHDLVHCGMSCYVPRFRSQGLIQRIRDNEYSSRTLSRAIERVKKCWR